MSNNSGVIEHIIVPSLLLVIFLLNASLAFQSTIPGTDEVLVGMSNSDPAHRLDSKEAPDSLRLGL